MLFPMKSDMKVSSIPLFQHGMGNLRITESGIRLQGRAEFTDTLYAQTIAADQVYIYITTEYWEP